jgi:hypothetical protein
VLTPRIRLLSWSVAAYFMLDKQGAVQILAEVERTVSTWRVRGRELGMNAAELEQFADAFEHREREVAQSISAGKMRVIFGGRRGIRYGKFT